MFLLMFYPPNGTEGGSIVFTYVLFGLRNVYWTFNFELVIRLFETLKMFYPPKGTEGGSIVFTYVLSPEGTLQSREPKEVQLFLLMNYCVRKRILDFQF